MKLYAQHVRLWWRARPRWKPITLGLGAALMLGVLVFWPAPQPAEGLAGLAPEPVSDLGLAARLLLNLGLVIGLIYGSLSLLRRWQGGVLGARPMRRLAVLETTRLSPRQAVHLLKVGERMLLLGATDQAVTLLAELETQAEVEANPARPLTPAHDSLPFLEMLRRTPELNRQIRA